MSRWAVLSLPLSTRIFFLLLLTFALALTHSALATSPSPQPHTPRQPRLATGPNLLASSHATPAERAARTLSKWAAGVYEEVIAPLVREAQRALRLNGSAGSIAAPGNVEEKKVARRIKKEEETWSLAVVGARRVAQRVRNVACEAAERKDTNGIYDRVLARICLSPESSGVGEGDAQLARVTSGNSDQQNTGGQSDVKRRHDEAKCPRDEVAQESYEVPPGTKTTNESFESAVETTEPLKDTGERIPETTERLESGVHEQTAGRYVACSGIGVQIGSAGCLCPVDRAGAACGIRRTMRCSPVMEKPARVCPTGNEVATDGASKRTTNEMASLNEEEERVDSSARPTILSGDDDGLFSVQDTNEAANRLHYDTNLDGDPPCVFLPSTQETLQMQFRLHCILLGAVQPIPEPTDPADQALLAEILAQETPNSPRGLPYAVSGLADGNALTTAPMDLELALRPVNWNRPFSDLRFRTTQRLSDPAFFSGERAISLSVPWSTLTSDRGYAPAGRVYLEARIVRNDTLYSQVWYVPLDSACWTCVERVFVDVSDYIEPTRLENFWTAWKIGIITIAVALVLAIILCIATYAVKAQLKRKRRAGAPVSAEQLSWGVPNKVSAADRSFSGQ